MLVSVMVVERLSTSVMAQGGVQPALQMIEGDTFDVTLAMRRGLVWCRSAAIRNE